MAKFEEITVVLPDGYPAYGRYWSPPRPQGAVLYHHGIQSHCGWYEGSASSLVEAGYAVLQVDRRGCGKNERERGHAESAEELIGDAHAARDELIRRSGQAEHHVVGVSWGGKLAVVAYVQDPAGVLSLSLVTPGLFPLVGVSKQEMSRIAFSMLYEPSKRFDIPLNEGELFTAVPGWKEYIDTDPLTLRQCSASFYLASRRMDKTVAKLSSCAPVGLHLLLAGDERIIDGEKTAAFVRDLGWSHAPITCYEKARHSLEFEVEREDYWRDLVAFIEGAS